MKIENNPLFLNFNRQKKIIRYPLKNLPQQDNMLRKNYYGKKLCNYGKTVSILVNT